MKLISAQLKAKLIEIIKHAKFRSGHKIYNSTTVKFETSMRSANTQHEKLFIGGRYPIIDETITAEVSVNTKTMQDKLDSYGSLQAFDNVINCKQSWTRFVNRVVNY